MNPFHITLPTPRHPKRWSVTGISLTAAFPALLLAFSPLPLAAQGKKPGGTGTTIPPLVSTPAVSYTKSALRWLGDQEPGFRGIYMIAVNSRGMAVGTVLPPHHPDGTKGGQLGVINLGANGQPSTTLVDLNVVFAESLANLNSGLASLFPEVPGWIISYAADINEAGQIACQLVRANEPYNDGEPIVRLFAVASLDLIGTGNAITLVDDEAVADRRIRSMTEHGDVLVSGSFSVENSGVVYYDHVLYENRSASGTLPASGMIVPEFDKTPLDVVGYFQEAQINSALQIAWKARDGDYQVKRRDLGIANAQTLTLWSGSSEVRLCGIAENGSVYATGTYAKGKTGTPATFSVFHGESRTLRGKASCSRHRGRRCQPPPPDSSGTLDLAP